MSFQFAACLERLEAYGLPSIPLLAIEIHKKFEAPPRLIAHHFLVHQVASELLCNIRTNWPGLEVDTEAVAFGAATHDIGKSLATLELSESGSEHERLGFEMLCAESVPTRFARFARDHGLGARLEQIEELLVCTADKCWKGKRQEELEEKLARMICRSADVDFWEAYPRILDIVDTISAKAELRLAIQAEFPCSTESDRSRPIELPRNPEGAQAFDHHVERIISFFREICPEATWTQIRFVEGDLCMKSSLAMSELFKPEEYRPKFCELLEAGHGWINLSASGVLNDWLILSLEWPAYENEVPREYVSVNLSGPYRGTSGKPSWDLSGRLTLLKDE